jgi:TonB family protein
MIIHSGIVKEDIMQRRFYLQLTVALLLLITDLPGAIAQSFTPAKPYGESKLVGEFLCSEVVYPDVALEKGQEGTVVIVFQVAADGTVSNIHVKEHVSPEIDEEAVRIFRLLQWEPAIRLGNPVTTQAEYSIKFDIKKYNRHCKQRGYERTDYPYTPVDTSLIVYNIDLLDKGPQPLFEDKSMNLGRFITQNLIYPDAAYKQNISGKVELSFVVEVHGRVSNILVDKPIAGGCTEEAIRLLKLITWMPGIKDKMAVRSRITIAITFTLPDESKMKAYDNNPTGSQ